MEKPQLTPLKLLAILMVYTGLAEFTVMTPAIATISMQFTSVPLSTVMVANNITGVVAVIFSILSGAVLNKVGFRPTAIIGFLIMIIGGVYPFFFPEATNFALVMSSRTIVGIGEGIMTPVGAALIILFLEGEKRSRFLGFGVLFQFAMAIIFSMLSGYLAVVGWNYSFLTYLASIVPLIFIVIGLPEGKPYALAKAEEEKAQLGGVKEKIPNAIWAYAVWFIVIWVAQVVINFLSSVIVVDRGMGDAATAGTMVTCYCVGAAIAGFIFGFLLQKLGKKLVWLSSFVLAIGMLVCYFSTAAWQWGIAAFFVGVVSIFLNVIAVNCAGNLAPKSRVSFVSGFMVAMINLGAFIGGYYLTAAQTMFSGLGAGAPLATSAVIMAIVGIAAIFMPFKALFMKPAAEEEEAPAEA